MFINHNSKVHIGENAFNGCPVPDVDKLNSSPENEKKPKKKADIERD